MLRQASDERQVLVSTQSVELVNALEPGRHHGTGGVEETHHETASGLRLGITTWMTRRSAGDTESPNMALPGGISSA